MKQFPLTHTVTRYPGEDDPEQAFYNAKPAHFIKNNKKGIVY